MRELIHRWTTTFPERESTVTGDLGLLVLRTSVGLMMAFSHGLGKLTKLLAGGEISFSDPLGIGATASLLLAASAEFFASLALVAGVATRLCTLPLAFTMCVAAFVVHADDPFRKQEFALLYLTIYVGLLLLGPGRFSIDAWLRPRLTR